MRPSSHAGLLSVARRPARPYQLPKGLLCPPKPFFRRSDRYFSKSFRFENFSCPTFTRVAALATDGTFNFTLSFDSVLPRAKPVIVG